MCAIEERHTPSCRPLRKTCGQQDIEVNKFGKYQGVKNFTFMDYLGNSIVLFLGYLVMADVKNSNSGDCKRQVDPKLLGVNNLLFAV